MNKLFLGCAVLAAMSICVLSDNCTSTCKDYSVCTTLVNQTALTGFLNNSLMCSADNDKKLGILFDRLDDCKLIEAGIEVADLLDIAWDGASAVEALMSDQDFWRDTCEWQHMAAAACVYFSLPEDDTCTNEPVVQKSDMFCAGECMKIANSCFNLDKYKQLNTSVTSFCSDVTVTGGTENCYRAQIDQTGLSKPDCSIDTVKSANLLGPYIVGAIGLALAVVALVGLVFITCKRADAGGAPNSF